MTFFATSSPRVGGRGRGNPAAAGLLRPPYAASLVAAPILALLLSGCAARQSPLAVQPGAPGFLEGLWHGFIFPIAWGFSLFTDKVALYAVPNNGGWYDFGFFLGVVVFGVGAAGARRR